MTSGQVASIASSRLRPASVADGRRDAVRGEDEPGAVRDLVSLLDEDGALLAQLVDDVAVVDDLLADVDRARRRPRAPARRRRSRGRRRRRSRAGRRRASVRCPTGVSRFTRKPSPPDSRPVDRSAACAAAERASPGRERQHTIDDAVGVEPEVLPLQRLRGVLDELSGIAWIADARRSEGPSPGTPRARRSRSRPRPGAPRRVRIRGAIAKTAARRSRSSGLANRALATPHEIAAIREQVGRLLARRGPSIRTREGRRRSLREDLDLAAPERL